MEKKSFDELYKEILNEYKNTYRKKQLESLKSSIKETYRRFLIELFMTIVFGIFISILFKKNLIFYFFAFYILLYLAYIMTYKNSKFNILFKNEIIGKMIRNFGDDFSYDFQSGFSSSEVLNVDMTLWHNYFHSEDLITGKLFNGFPFKSSEIYLRKDAGKQIYTVFKGTLTQVKLPTKVSNEVVLNYIASDPQKSVIELESQDFKDVYQLSSKDRILAAKLFTTEVINKINSLNDYKAINFLNIIIKDDTINFFYVFPGSYLEKNLLFPLNEKSLKQIYSEIKLNIEFSHDISQMIVNNIEK